MEVFMALVGSTFENLEWTEEHIKKTIPRLSNPVTLIQNEYWLFCSSVHSKNM